MKNSSKPTIGIIGNGFIGSAVSDAFLHYTDVKVFDTSPARTINEYVDCIQQDIIFLCVPTPMNKDGSVDLSIVDEALEKLSNNIPSGEVKPVLLKSTVPPAELGQFMLKYAENILLVFNPEFLTERSARHEYIQSNRFIFGTLYEFDKTPEAKRIDELFELRFPAVPRYWTTFIKASLTKYFTNLYFSTRLSLMNEFAQVSQAWDVSPNEVMELVMLDARIGRSHWQVPGHDGRLGYGGSCFYKDTAAYIDIAKECGIDPKMGKANWNKNLEVRGATQVLGELDQMKGRAAKEKMTLDELFRIGK